MIYLCAAYLAIWSLVFGYLFHLRNKQRDLDNRLKAIGSEVLSREKV